MDRPSRTRPGGFKCYRDFSPICIAHLQEM